MLKEIAPELEWEVGVDSSEAGDKVILKRLNGALSCVDAMVAGFRQLPRYILGGDIVFNCLRTLIVCDI